MLEFESQIVWSDALTSQFHLDGEAKQVASGSANGSRITLKLKSPSKAKTVTYLDSAQLESRQPALRPERPRRADVLRSTDRGLADGPRSFEIPFLNLCPTTFNWDTRKKAERSPMMLKSNLQTVARQFLGMASILLALIVSSPSSAQAAEPLLQLRKGDRISYIGNTLADRMQHSAWLESYIHAIYPELDLTFRNLGYSGDELKLRQARGEFR